MSKASISMEYPFEQKPTKVSRVVAEGIDKLREYNIDERNILSIYNESKKPGKKRKNVTYPMLYVPDRENAPPNAIVPRYRDVESVYMEVINDWNKILPDEFLEQFESYVQHRYNESGWENGLLYNNFIMKAGSYENLLIVDPPPTFVRKCRSSTKKIMFAFSDYDYYLAYSSDKRAGVGVERLYGLPQGTYQRVLCFGNNLSEDELIHRLDHIRDVLADEKHENIYIVIPVKYLENRKSEPKFWDYINEYFSIFKIILIDKNVVNNYPKKIAVVVLQNVSGKNEEIFVQKTRLLKNNIFASLEFRRVPFCSFYERDRTLSEMYDTDYNDFSEPNRRNKPMEYKFTLEISVWLSFAENKNGRIRPTYGIYNYPSKEQLRKNTLPRGKSLIKKRISGNWYDSKVDAANSAEYLLLDNEDAAEKMCAAAKKEYEGRPVSIKTLIFFHWADMNKPKDFEKDLCREVFFRPGSSNEPICSMLVSVDDEEYISITVEEFVKKQNYSDAKATRLWKQLELAFYYAVIDGRCKFNPISRLMNKKTNQKKAETEMRAAMIKDSLEKVCEEKLIEYLLADKEHTELAIMHLVRYYSGQSVNVLRALTCQDFVYDPKLELGQLAITKSMYPRSDEVYEIEPAECRRLVPLPAYVTRLLINKLMGVREGNRPLFSTHKRTNKVFSSKQIHTYLNNILENVLDLPEYVVPVFQNEDTVTEVDLNEYGGDILRSNFVYYAYKQALLEPEEVDFILGRQPRTTEARYYCDFNNKYIQQKMRVKLDRWASNSDKILKAERKTPHVLMLEGGKQYKIDSSPENTRKEVCIELDINDVEGDEIDLQVFARFGGTLQIEYYEEE